MMVGTGGNRYHPVEGSVNNLDFGFGPRLRDLDTMAAEERIEVKTATVGCDGGLPSPKRSPGSAQAGGASGHPMVYLKIGVSGEIACPYCSRRYVLAPGEQDAPAEADH